VARKGKLGPARFETSIFLQQLAFSYESLGENDDSYEKSYYSLGKSDNFPIFPDFYRFLGLSWETSTLKNYHPEDSKHSGSGRIEFSSKSTTFLM
jgi:hypothetical protein